ncbi:MAG: DNA gyrase inhibitor YacG [Planctomycetaceae bacterium]|nr:DNA gyrase inhibitor YacG [Planctomycetaceae bacterium]MCA9098065.1 DNA gyrase inhibitor YacG [Planctomycetaceae bacterium]
MSEDEQKYAPFCSSRCRQIDFFRWSDGKYKIVEEIDPSLIPEMGPEDLPPAEG